MSWKGWLVIVILLLIAAKDPNLIQTIISGVLNIFNSLGSALSNINLGGSGG